MTKSAQKKVLKSAKTDESPLRVYPDPTWVGWVSNHGVMLYSCIAAVLLLLLFGDFLSGRTLYLFDDVGSDTLNIFFPQLKHIADYLRQEGIPAWSFSQGIGQNIYPNSLSDPFNYILYAMGGEQLAYGLAWVECLKIFLGGWIFSRYLRLMQLDGYVAMLGGLFFAFSGYAIIGSTWYIFSSNLVHIALLLLGFELYFQRGIWWLFPLAFGLVFAFSPAFSFLYAVFLALYFVWRFISYGKEQRWQRFARLSLGLAGLAMVGAALSSVIWLPAVKEMLDSPRMGIATLSDRLKQLPIFGVANDQLLSSSVLRSFANDLAGTPNKFFGWKSYLESPNNYCGLLCLLLAPQIFSAAGRREKIMLGVLLGVYIIPQIFPWFRYAMWLFSGNYFRNFSHIFGIILQIYALIALNRVVRENKLNGWLLGATMVALLAFLFVFQVKKEMPGLRAEVVVLLVVQTALIYLATFRPARSFALALLPLVVVFELFLNARPALHDRGAVSRANWEKSYYHDSIGDAFKWIQEKDSSFYRINRDGGSGAKEDRSINDGKVYGYFGNTSYHSFNHPGLVNLDVGIGVIDTNSTRKDTLERPTRWSQGVPQVVFLQYLTASKYSLYKKPIWRNRFLQTTTDSLTTIGDVKVLRSHLAVPFGSTYARYIPDTAVIRLKKRDQRGLSLMKACAIRPEDISLMDGLTETLADSIPLPNQYFIPEMEKDVQVLRVDTFQTHHFDQNHIAGSIDLKQKKILVLSVPLDKGWKVSLDGKPYQPILVNFAFMGFPLEAGHHEIDMYFEVPWLKVGGYVTVGALALYLLLLLGSWFFRSKKPQPINPQTEQ